MKPVEQHHLQQAEMLSLTLDVTLATQTPSWIYKGHGFKHDYDSILENVKR